MKFVDIPTAVEARFDDAGRVTPTTFRTSKRVRIKSWIKTVSQHPRS